MKLASPLGIAVFLNGGGNLATFGATTTGAATLTIAALTVSAATTVDWGDGSSNVYTGSGARTHNYAGAGTYNFKITPASNVTAITLEDNKITLNSSAIKGMINIQAFRADGVKDGNFNSSDVALWCPTTFQLFSMPAGYTGTFNFSDISAWRPTTFSLLAMPTGYAGTFNSSDVAAWNPVSFQMFTMPAATFTILAAAGGFSAWKAATSFRIDGNSLSQAKVNQILSDLWSAFATRTGAAGTINVGGTNAAPSGTYQAANPPTTGKEFAYELLNDSQNINPTKKWATVTFTA